MEVEAPTTVSRNIRDQLDPGTPHTPGLSLVGTGLSGSMNSATATAAARMTGDHSHVGSQVVITLTKDDSKTITKGKENEKISNETIFVSDVNLTILKLLSY